MRNSGKERAMLIKKWGLAAIGGVLAAVTLAAFTTGTLRAQKPPTPPASMAGSATHEQMHDMIDMMHGDGASQRLHEALGDDADRMLEQCMAMMQGMGMDMAAMMGMMAMMQQMGGMMGGMAAPAPTQEQVHAVMDGMMEAGFAERMHAALPDASGLMAQCAAMMAMLGTMPGMEA